MNKAPQGSEPMPHEPDDLKPVDQALLLAVARRQHDHTPLTLDQERLVDDWIAGRLSPADAGRAAELTKRSSFAAERVLERRLVEAANTGTGVPADLSARVLSAHRPAKAETRSFFQFRLPSFSGLQWSAAGAVFAATIAVAVFSFQNLQERSQSDQRIQVAMVTIDDRGPMSGTRMRSLGNQPTAPAENAYRDIDVPAEVMRRALMGAGADRATAAALLMSFLPLPAEPAGKSVRILIDSALAERLSSEWRTRSVAPIRVYDLDDPRAAAIRSTVSAQATAGTLVLLTVRP